MAQVAGKRPMVPFRYGTRQRMYPMPTQQFAANNRVSFRLPQVGYISGLLLRFSGTIRRTAGDTNAAVDGLFMRVLNRLQVTLNIGASNPVDIAGEALFYFQYLLERGMHPSLGGVGSTTPVADVTGPFSFPIPGVGFTDTPFVYHLFIPVSTNNGRNFETGLINAQAVEIQCNLDIKCGQVSDFFPTGSVVAGTSFVGTPNLDLSILYYEVPRPGSNVILPDFVLHRLVSEVSPIFALGDATYTANREGTLLQLFHMFVINGSLSNLVTDHRIRLNKQDEHYKQDRQTNEWYWRKQLATNPVAGIQLWDFFHADQRVSHGDGRDTYDLRKITTFESIHNVIGPLGVNNNFMYSVRRILQAVPA